MIPDKMFIWEILQIILMEIATDKLYTRLQEFWYTRSFMKGIL